MEEGISQTAFGMIATTSMEIQSCEKSSWNPPQNVVLLLTPKIYHGTIIKPKIIEYFLESLSKRYTEGEIKVCLFC